MLVQLDWKRGRFRHNMMVDSFLRRRRFITKTVGKCKRNLNSYLTTCSTGSLDYNDIQRIVFLLSFGSFELPPYKVMSVKHFHEVYCEFNTFGPLLHRIIMNDKRHDMSEDLAFLYPQFFYCTFVCCTTRRSGSIIP